MVRQGTELGLRKEADLSVTGSFGTAKLLAALTLRPGGCGGHGLYSGTVGNRRPQLDPAQTLN